MDDDLGSGGTPGHAERTGPSRAGVFAWLERRATGPVVLGLLALETALLGGENAFDFPLSVPYMRKVTGHPFLDMCAFCSAGQERAWLDAFGDAGRRLQLWLMPTIDLAIPITSALFGLCALSWLGARAAPGWGTFARWALSLPLLAMALDFAENTEIIALLGEYPRASPALAALAGVTTGVKFCAYAATLAATGALLLADGVRRLRASPPVEQ